MTPNRDSIVDFTGAFLSLSEHPDYGPMGLQFAGAEKVTGVATAVSVSKDVIERTRLAQCNLLVVHHGMFWNNESRVLDERVGGRLKLLEKYNITLLAYHLALDAHPKIGNNILLARALGLGHLTPWQDIGWSGVLREPMFWMKFYGAGCRKLGLPNSNTEGLYYHCGKPEIEKVAVIAGGAAHYITEAKRDGFDTFVTGEPSEPSLYLAQDLGMNFFAFGHDKTERAGVQKLGQLISRKFRIPHEFLPVSNPV